MVAAVRVALLFFEQLARDVFVVAFGEHFLAHRWDGFARSHPCFRWQTADATLTFGAAVLVEDQRAPALAETSKNSGDLV